MTHRLILLFIFQLAVTLSFGKESEKVYKTLYLLRHAKSSNADSTLLDFDRPLSDRGFRDAPQMGKVLKKRGVMPDIIVASPSKRTKQTIELVTKEIGFSFEKITWNQSIYRCTVQELLTAIKGVDNQYQSAMFVGHNPSMTQAANELQKKMKIEEVVTCGVVGIQFATDNWSNISSENATFLFFERPKQN